MNNNIIPILKQHIQWKEFCINSLNKSEFSNGEINSTKSSLVKMLQRDKFFLELYLRTISPTPEMVFKNYN